MGLIMHVIAKVVFVAVGYAIHMYLGKTLSPAIYGSIGVIMSIININYNFLSNGARQVVSHLIAANKYNHKDLIIKSYIYQMIISGILVMVNYWGAGFISQILNHPELKMHIQITAIIIPFTALYFISVGVLNGYKLLVYEALTVTMYPVARLTIIPFVEYVCKDSVLGTICGFFVAAIIGCIVGNFGVIKKTPNKPVISCKISNKEYIKQVIEFLSFFLCITIILNMDMLFVNALVHDGTCVGYYTGASNFSKVSYYLLSAIYLVALPIVTSQYSKNKMQECRNTITNLLVLILSFILPIVTIAGPICANLMEVFYTNEYRQASLSTEILMISQFFLGLFVVINILICSTNRKAFSTILGIGVVITDAIMCLILIPKYSILGASIASLVTNVVGVIIAYKQLCCIYGDVWNKKLTQIIGMNLLTFTIMTLLNRVWSSSSFFIVITVCAFAYILFELLLIALHFVKIKEIMMVFSRK